MGQYPTLNSYHAKFASVKGAIYSDFIMNESLSSDSVRLDNWPFHFQCYSWIVTKKVSFCITIDEYCMEKLSVIRSHESHTSTQHMIWEAGVPTQHHHRLWRYHDQWSRNQSHIGGGVISVGSGCGIDDNWNVWPHVCTFHKSHWDYYGQVPSVELLGGGGSGPLPSPLGSYSTAVQRLKKLASLFYVYIRSTSWKISMT